MTHPERALGCRPHACRPHTQTLVGSRWDHPFNAHTTSKKLCANMLLLRWCRMRAKTHSVKLRTASDGSLKTYKKRRRMEPRNLMKSCTAGARQAHASPARQMWAPDRRPCLAAWHAARAPLGRPRTLCARPAAALRLGGARAPPVHPPTLRPPAPHMPLVPGSG